MEAAKKMVGGKKSQSKQYHQYTKKNSKDTLSTKCTLVQCIVSKRYWIKLYCNYRLEAFQMILDQAHIDLKALQDLCFNGIPEEDTALKAKCWKILLGYLPLERSQWQAHLEQQRAMYSFYINLLFQTPDNNRIQEKEKKEEMKVSRMTRAATVDENGMEKEEEKRVKWSQSQQRSHSQKRLIGEQGDSQSSLRQTGDQKQKQKEERLKRQKKAQQKLKALFSDDDDNDNDDLIVQSHLSHTHNPIRTNALWGSDHSDNDNPLHSKESEKKGNTEIYELVIAKEERHEKDDSNSDVNRGIVAETSQNNNGRPMHFDEDAATNKKKDEKNTEHANIDVNAKANETTENKQLSFEKLNSCTDPLSTNPQNPWLSYFEDWKIWNTIEKDIHRTHQSFAFFRSREMIHERSLSKSYRFPFDYDAVDPDIVDSRTGLAQMTSRLHINPRHSNDDDDNNDNDNDNDNDDNDNDNNNHHNSDNGDINGNNDNNQHYNNNNKNGNEKNDNVSDQHEHTIHSKRVAQVLKVLEQQQQVDMNFKDNASSLSPSFSTCSPLHAGVMSPDDGAKASVNASETQAKAKPNTADPTTSSNGHEGVPTSEKRDTVSNDTTSQPTLHLKTTAKKSSKKKSRSSANIKKFRYERYTLTGKDLGIHAQIMIRILCVYARLNKGVNYIQGMNEIVYVHICIRIYVFLAPIYFVFASDTSDEGIYAEADAFHCFGKMMSSLNDRFTGGAICSQFGITTVMDEFNDLLHLADPSLYLALNNQFLYPQFYVLRWLMLLMAVEFQLPDVLRLWDAYPNRFDFVTYFAVAMMQFCQICLFYILCLLNVRAELIEGNFGANLQLLQSYPIADPIGLLKPALELRNKFPIPRRRKTQNPLAMLVIRITDQNDLDTKICFFVLIPIKSNTFYFYSFRSLNLLLFLGFSSLYLIIKNVKQSYHFFSKCSIRGKNVDMMLKNFCRIYCYFLNFIVNIFENLLQN
ncbi:TBC1 domain family, member 13 [Reticulomyxa filosa]|uniref:TBC1 domain family, member 13 n=1 Tax=Reticulomyxa filosa TaxID=46433 RepID=X6NFQ9_RETFI|nr:TBC1 domain family, member 13 [Reticulomyxa filosa]|eukprot:ETO24733.1 TBC1 domain family, member 13 [Reticulomyxa filosa]